MTHAEAIAQIAAIPATAGTFYVTMLMFDGRELERTFWGLDAQDAMERAEKEYNSPLWVGPVNAASRIADGDGCYTQDGGFLVPTEKMLVRALRAARGRSEYVALGAYCYKTDDVTLRAARQ